jgi:uncharacterized SAM-dependent methyltransferase
MKYFKNTELAKLYNVSEKSVRNWIEATQAGKLDLELYTENDKSYIANTAKNNQIVEQLVQKGKKYKNTRGHKIVTPVPKFYELYSPKQIFDIISSLDIHHEIPRQYNYFDGGASYWDKYTLRLATEDTPNILTSTFKLLEMNKSYIENLLSSYKRVNVIDVGVGNGLPVKEFLADLLEKGVLGRYIALDISKAMLEIAGQNIKKWFNGQVAYEGYELDINYDRFTNILAEEYIKKESKDTVNLVLVFGGTLGNLRSPDGALKAIRDSMGRNDFFLHTQKLDTETTRRYFDFNLGQGNSSLAPNHRFIFDLLNIDESFYEAEMGYDEQRNERYIRVRLKVAVTIKFEFEGGERLVELNKDDTLLLWRYWHQNVFEVLRLFERNDFNPLQVSQTEDREYLLTISQIKSQ